MMVMTDGGIDGYGVVEFMMHGNFMQDVFAMTHEKFLFFDFWLVMRWQRNLWILVTRKYLLTIATNFFFSIFVNYSL